MTAASATDPAAPSSRDFDAFISYRHVDPDSDVARVLQVRLEGQHRPKRLDPHGRSRKAIVFLDNTELQSGRISDALVAALTKSRYLVVLCSRRTPESDWVEQEIRTFLLSHPPTRIIVIVLETDPSLCLPTILRNLIPERQPDAGQDEEGPHVISAWSGRSRRHVLPKAAWIATWARILALDPGVLTSALRSERRTRIALGATMSLLVGVGAAVWLNAEVSWSRSTSRDSRARGGPFGNTPITPLRGNRVLAMNEGVVPSVLDPQRTPPTLLRSFPSAPKEPWDRVLDIQPYGHWVLVSTLGGTRVWAVDVDSGEAIETPMPGSFASLGPALKGGFVAENVIWYEPNPGDLERIEIFDLVAKRPLASIIASYTHKPPLPTEPSPDSFNPDFFARGARQAFGFRIAADGIHLVGLTFQGQRMQTSVWSLAGGQRLSTLSRGSASAQSLFAMAPDGNTLAVLDVDPATEAIVSLWDLRTMTLRRDLRFPRRTFTSVAFSRDGRLLLLAGSTMLSLSAGDLGVDRETGTDWIMLYPGYAEHGVWSLAQGSPSPIALLGDGGATQSWSLRAGEAPLPIPGLSLSTGDEVVPDLSLRLVLVARGGSGVIARLPAGPVVPVHLSADRLSAFFSLDGNALGVLRRDHKLELFETRSGRHLTTMGAAGSNPVLSYDPECRRMTILAGPERFVLQEDLFAFRRPIVHLGLCAPLP